VETTSAFTIEECYPPFELNQGIDIFDIENPKKPPIIGRAMVVLKRL
jgi:hypothetical protein